MKLVKHSYLIVFLLVSVFSFGQIKTKGVKETKWTIGAILINGENFYNYYGRPSMPQSYFDGITVKWHFKNLAARAAIEHINTTTIPFKNDFYSKVNGYFTEGIVRFGIEKGFSFKNKYRPYFAIDIAGIQSYSDYTEDIHGAFIAINHRYITKTKSIGIMPTIGFEYKFTKAISLSIETRERCFYSWQTKNTKDLYDSSEPYTEKNRFFDFYLNILGGLTLNVNF